MSWSCVYRGLVKGKLKAPSASIKILGKEGPPPLIAMELTHTQLEQCCCSHNYIWNMIPKIVLHIWANLLS